jgi:hypothetical protein
MATRAAHNQHLHIWMGRNASLDKRTAGAIRAVLLATHVGGAAQHVEEQGAESDRFRSYYMGDLKVIPGGAPSGFRPSALPPRPVALYFLVERKGKLFVRRVPAARSWLNANGAFVLDAPSAVWAWAGRGASPHQAFQALALAAFINKTERRSAAPVQFCQQGAVCLPPPPPNPSRRGLPLIRPPDAGKAVQAARGGASGEPATAGGGGEQLEALAAGDVLYGTSTDAGGNVALGIEWSAAEQGVDALQRALLRSANAYVLDAGHEVLTWYARCNNCKKQRVTRVLGLAPRPPRTSASR